MFRWINIALVMAFGVGCGQVHACTSPATIEQKASAHQDTIQRYASQYGVSAEMVKAVIAVESCYNSTAVSPKGAMGLMQLIPATADRFGVVDAFDENENIHAGTRYLSWLLKRYDGDLHKAIAAYNAGEGAVDKHNGIPPYSETQQYVRKVLGTYNRLSGQAIPLPAVATAQTPAAKAIKAKYTPDTATTPAEPVGETALPLPPSKPGRAGWRANKAKAPHLYKQSGG